MFSASSDVIGPKTCSVAKPEPSRAILNTVPVPLRAAAARHAVQESIAAFDQRCVRECATGVDRARVLVLVVATHELVRNVVKSVPSGRMLNTVPGPPPVAVTPKWVVP